MKNSRIVACAMAGVVGAGIAITVFLNNLTAGCQMRSFV